MVIADTGLWIALAFRTDRWHQRAIEVLDTLDEPLITTWPVLTEAFHLLLARGGPHAMLGFAATLESGALEVFDLARADTPRIAELMRTYQSLPMDLADASLVVLAEHLGHGRILSTDRRDFGAYRWKQHEPFTNLLDAVG